MCRKLFNEIKWTERIFFGKNFLDGIYLGSYYLDKNVQFKAFSRLKHKGWKYNIRNIANNVSSLYNDRW